jgi:rubrerythrin
MLVASIFAVAVALAVFVVYPVLSDGGDDAAIVPVDVSPAADLKRRRMVVYENLRDLEFEYQAKKIASNDYESLRESYRSEAARLMLASQELERGAVEDRFIEKEVAARRASLKRKVAQAYLCRQCGFENPIPVKFCGECGAPLSKAQ